MYYIATTRISLSDRAARSLNAKLHKIDPTMEFVSICAAGNELRGWIERPNDGKNDHRDQLDRNHLAAQLLKVAENQAKGQRQ